MATLTGKAVSELPEASAVNDADLFAISQSGSSKKVTKSTLLGGFVSKSGDTMTGNINLQSNSLEDGTAVTQETFTPRLYFQDKNGSNLGYIAEDFLTDGRQGAVFRTQRTVNGSLLSNILGLFVGADGTRSVLFSEARPWRRAISLGDANGDLPITIEQGGSGQTGVSSETTINDIITASSGYTVTGISFSTWGKVAQLTMKIKKSSAATISGLTAIATLKSGYRPKASATATSPQDAITKCYVNSTGVIYVTGTFEANTEYSILSTFILS